MRVPRLLVGWVAVAVFASLVATPRAEADKIYLRERGRVIEGTIVEETVSRMSSRLPRIYHGEMDGDDA